MTEINKISSIAVDLDGTLAEHTEWKGIEFIGKPIPAMMDRVKKWLAEGRSVVIFTARANMPGAIPYIQKWLKENGLPEDLKITNVKDSKMEQIWDDRAVRVEMNTGKAEEPPAKKKADVTNAPGDIDDERERELRKFGYPARYYHSLRDDRGYKKNPYEYEEFWYYLHADLMKDMRLRFRWGRAGHTHETQEKVVQIDKELFDKLMSPEYTVKQMTGSPEAHQIVLEIAQREGIIEEFEKMRGVLVPGNTPEVRDQQTRRLERMLKHKISSEQEEDVLVKESYVQKVAKEPKSFLNHVLNVFHVDFEYNGKPIVMQVTLRKDPETGDMRWDAIPFSMQEEMRENYKNLSPEQKVVIKKEAIDKALADNDPADILDYEERFVYREALRQGMVTDVIDYWKKPIEIYAFLPEEAGRISQNSLRKRIFLAWLQKSWVAPDGKVFPFTKEIHGQWAMENKDMLGKVYGIKTSKYMLEDMLDNGWLRVSKDGIHFIDLDKSESAIDQFLKDNENDIPDELHIDVAKESFAIQKQDVMEHGIKYALGRANKRPWWMERKDASLGKKASKPKITISQRPSGTKEAETQTDEIILYPKFFTDYDKQQQRTILTHEMGHWFRQNNVAVSEIMGWKEGEKFFGLFGRDNSEEGFAEAFMYYLDDPEHLKKLYPEQYEQMAKYVGDPEPYRKEIDDLISTGINKKASSVGTGWISPEGKFYPRAGGSHAIWLHENRDITGIDFKDIPRDATLTDQQRDAILKEAMDKGWIGVTVSGFYVNNTDYSQLKNVEDYVISNKDAMPHHFYLGYWGDKGSGKSDYLITKDVLDKGIESQIRVIKRGSILDYPHPGLSPDVWDKENKLLPQHKERILKILMNAIQEKGWKTDPKTWITNIYIIGSLTSYQYSYKTDIDVHIHASLEDLNEQEFSNSISSNDLAEILDQFRMDINAKKEVLPGTTHPIEFFFEAYLGRGMEKAQRNYIMKAQTPEGIYDLEKDEWLQPPRTVDIDFDPDEFVPAQTWKEINDIIEGLDVTVGKIERNMTSIDDLMDVIKAWSIEGQKRFKDKIEERLKVINEEVDKIIGTVQKVIDNRHIDYRPESNANLTFKALQKFNYIAIKKGIETILESDGLITEKNKSVLEEVLDNPEEVESQPAKGKKVKTELPLNESIPALAYLEKVAIRPAFYLTDAHAQMVWRGEKELIVKARMFKRFIGEERYLASREKVYGIITLEQPEVVDLKEFGAREKEHRVTEEERERWWPTADHFYLYPFEFEPFRLPTGWEPIRKTRKKTTEEGDQPVGTATREGEKPKKEPSKENTDETSSTAKAGSKDPYKIDYEGNYCAMYDIRILDSAHPLSAYDYHITHKFFGPLEPKIAKEIQDVIAQYWDTHPFKPMTLKFNREEYFGPEKDIHVLRISDESLTPQLEIAELRKQLDTYVKDTYEGGYKPHVTIPDEDIHEIEAQVTGYQFKKGKEVIQEWRPEEATGQIRTNLFASTEGPVAWIDPNGKLYEFERWDSHPKWVWEHRDMLKKEYGLDISEEMLNAYDPDPGGNKDIVMVLFNAGWVRMTTWQAYQLYTDKAISTLNDFLLSHQDTVKDKNVYLDYGLKYLTISGNDILKNGLKEEIEHGLRVPAQQKEWLAVTTPRAAQSLKNVSVLGREVVSDRGVVGRGSKSWIDPKGKKYWIEGEMDAHAKWIVDNALMLKNDYGITIPEVKTQKQFEDVYESLYDYLYDAGWVRADGWDSFQLKTEGAVKTLQDYLFANPELVGGSSGLLFVTYQGKDYELSVPDVMDNGLLDAMSHRAVSHSTVSSTRISQAYPTDMQMMAQCSYGHTFSCVPIYEASQPHPYTHCPFCKVPVPYDKMLPFPDSVDISLPNVHTSSNYAPISYLPTKLHEGQGTDTMGGKVGQTDVTSESIRSQIPLCQIAGRKAPILEGEGSKGGVSGSATTGGPTEGDRPSSETVGVSGGSQTREGAFMPSDSTTPPAGPIDFRTDPYINNPETEVFPYGKRPPSKLPLAPVKKRPRVRNPHHTQDGFPELQPYQPGMTVNRDKNDNPQSGTGDRESENTVVLDTTNMFELPIGDRGKNLSSPGMFPFWKRKKR